MLKSMTGYGRAKSQLNGLDITVEIKSVNHRYFEFTTRVPKNYMFLEEKLKSFCHDKISRGKVEVSVTIEEIGSNSTDIQINYDFADSYIKSLNLLCEKYNLANDINVSTLSSIPEMFIVKKNEIPDDIIIESVMKVTEESLNNFITMRENEGERLKEDVKKRAVYILEQVALIEQRSPETVNAYREKLEQKIKELLGDTSVDEQRLITETAIFADKVAVAEETVRLRSHIKQFCLLLESNEPVGRKLDFIVQEMNRETNTIGSKALDIDISHKVVDIKSEIEKIREQIQNIE